MEITKSTDSSFVIKDDAKVVSFFILALLLLITIYFFATVPDIAGMGLLCLILIVFYLFFGYISRTYTFDKKENTFSEIETTFFKIKRKHYALDNIQSIVFLRIQPYGSLFPKSQAAAELRDYAGIIVILKTGEKVRVIPSADNYTIYLFQRDIVTLNESEAKVGKEIADFLHVPFEVKEKFDIYQTKGPSTRFIKFLFKIVYALLIGLAIFVFIIFLIGLVN